MGIQTHQAEAEDPDDMEGIQEQDCISSCPVCLNDFRSSSNSSNLSLDPKKSKLSHPLHIVSTPCGHLICSDCGQRLTSGGTGTRNCPICRANIAKRDLIKINTMSIKYLSKNEKIDLAKNLGKIQKDRCLLLKKCINEARNVNKSLVKNIKMNRYYNKCHIPKKLASILSSLDVKSLDLRFKQMEQIMSKLSNDIHTLVERCNH